MSHLRRPLVSRLAAAAARAPALMVCLAVIALAGCGGGGGGHHSIGVASHLDCTGAVTPAADEVVFGCPASSAGTMTVTVIMGGPTSTDIYAVDFDVLFDPAVLRFNGASANGSFLAQGGATLILEAGAASNDPGRLVVAVSRQGAVPGVQGAGASQTVVTLSFSGMSAGTTALTFDNAAALDSTSTPIPGITFGPAVSVTFAP